ncbi:MAG: phage late control D family protein [Colwellia sp.]|nr:phage late control D family protein [Colwellia sp.]
MASPRLLINCANATYAANYLQGSDTLSEQSHYTVIVDTLEIQPLQQGLGQTACLNFIASDGYTRSLNTTLLSIEDKGVIGANHADKGTCKRRYQLTLGARITLLDGSQHSRIFIDTNLCDILTLLLAGAGYHEGQISFTLATALPVLGQCVQAMESNKAFFNRLLRQYGLFYWFNSTGSDSGIVISDNNSSSPYLERGLLQVHHGVGFNPENFSSQQVSDLAAQGFVGFTQCQYTTQIKLGIASAVSNEYRLEGENLAPNNFAQPVSLTSGQAANVAQHQSQALNRFEQVITLTGNVPDIFAGCSFSLHDTSGINASGDYICISVLHVCQQPSDETSQDGLSKYHCVVKAIPRSQPFKLPFEAFVPLPMVFSAKVESISSAATLTDSGDYFTKANFDETARQPLTGTQPLRKLVNYACANQPQATGWHFPMVDNSQVLIGCLNNDPSQAYLIGFDMNEEQPAVVNSENHFHNRLLSRSGHELRFDDDDIIPTIILQTLGGEHYLELNAHTEGQQYIKWLSRLGTISFHAADKLLFSTELGNIDVRIGGYQHIDAKKSVSISVEADNIIKKDSLDIQSATHISHTAKKILAKSNGGTSFLTERSLNAAANSNIIWQSEQGEITISAPLGSTLVNADGNISITGTGSGDITLFNQEGMIKLGSNGNVELIGKDILTLKGQMITFDGDVAYDIESPISASEPSAGQPPTVGRIANFSLGGGSIDGTTQALELEYFYDTGEPVEDIAFEVCDATGKIHQGTLVDGLAVLGGIPVGQYEINYLATNDDDEQALIALRTNFKQHLNSMLAEIRTKAAIEDALFEQQSLFTQWAIQLGATMTGVYEGGESLVTGVADIVVLAVDINIQVYSACYDVINSLARGDIAAVKLQLETILAHSEKSLQGLTDAFELLVTIIEDEETRNALASFPGDYLDAHSFVEKHRIGGIFLFEILLAVLTAGVGSAVSAASKSKHVVKASKSLNAIADILKRKRLNIKKPHALSSAQPKAIAKIDKPIAELTVQKNRIQDSQTSHVKSAFAANILSKKSIFNNFDEIQSALAASRRQLIKTGKYQSKYTPTEMEYLVQQGKLEERYVVTLQKKKSSDNVVGFKRDSSRTTTWTTTVDQLENADSDPKLISDLNGMHYDPKAEYELIIIDQGKYYQTDGGLTFIPTYKNTAKLGKAEFTKDFSPEQIDHVMSPEYSKEYSNLMDEYKAKGLNPYSKDDIKDYIDDKFINNPEGKSNFKARHEFTLEIGTNEHFSGDGLTKTNGESGFLLKGQHGTLETITFEKSPATIAELEAKGAIIRLPAKPIN